MDALEDPPCTTVGWVQLTGAAADPWADETWSGGGRGGLLLVDLAQAPDVAPVPAVGAVRGVVVVGVDRAGRTPAGAVEACDVLLTTAPEAPRPWVVVAPGDLGAATDRLRSAVRASPMASVALAQLLRVGERATLEEAVVLESFTFSMLLAGPEFARWRATRPVRTRAVDPDAVVRLERTGSALHITLDRPAVHNAYSAGLRDEIVEALRLASADDTVTTVLVDGTGPSFSSGGDLDEFGTAPDPVRAHLVRLTRSAALAVGALAARTTVRLHGACMGAGIEIPAAAGRIEARRDTVVALPEVAMGLIPGAGGTATVPRRIGRHRTCWLALTGARLDAEQAHVLGLVDVVVDGW